MKKLIAFAVALLFLSVSGIAAATDVTMSGDYFVRGTYQKNGTGDNAMTAGIKNGTTVVTAKESGTMWYDHELNLKLNWEIDDSTIVYSQFDMRDETWGGDSLKEGTALNEDSEATLDSNVVIEKAYVWHKFASKHELTVGLTGTSGWGPSFDNAAADVYRVIYSVPTNVGSILGILQKGSEKSSTATGQGESEDTDAYYLAGSATFGNITISPLLAYVDGGNTSKTLKAILPLTGTFGDVGFETEFTVSDINMEKTSEKDYRTYGAYANVWYASGPVKVGMLGAYGSYDDKAKKGQSFGGDFDGGGAMIMGVDAGFGGLTEDDDGNLTGTVNDNLTAGRLVALYADYDINDKLSIGGYAGFAKCGIDDADNDEWNGAKVWEISADAAYKITDNIKYDVGAGVAQLKLGKAPAGVSDPEKAYRLFHRLTVNF
jgi:hypothetical protein